MAIKDLTLEIKRIVTEAEKKSRADLSRNKVETYVYHEKYIKEWCKWSQKYLGASADTSKMVTAFFDELEKGFRKSNEPFHFNRHNRGLRVTKVDKTTASRESGGREKRATLSAKKAALAVIEQTFVGPIKGKRQALSGLHGHHGGPTSSSPKTTLGMEEVRQNMPRSSGSLINLLDEVNDRTPVETLRDVVTGQFNDIIDHNMKLHHLPDKVMAIRNSRTTNPRNFAFRLTEAIEIKFALGSGTNTKGQAYTDALKDWDAGIGKGLGQKIDSILADIEAKTKKFIVDFMAKDAYNMLMIENSPSVIDSVLTETPKGIVASLFSHKTNPDMRLKVNKALFRKSATPRKGSTKFVTGTKKRGQSKRTRKRGLGPAVGASKMRTGGSGSNPMALKALLNEVLPAQVAQNMQSPALQFRTGRFANNVRVENITQGPRGGNTMIETSYRNDPYETFAKGGKMYTPQRDPDRLIRKSVRQVATGIVGSRFGVNVL
jgi:hypothetical protein